MLHPLQVEQRANSREIVVASERLDDEPLRMSCQHRSLLPIGEIFTDEQTSLCEAQGHHLQLVMPLRRNARGSITPAKRAFQNRARCGAGRQMKNVALCTNGRYNVLDLSPNGSLRW